MLRPESEDERWGRDVLCRWITIYMLVCVAVFVLVKAFDAHHWLKSHVAGFGAAVAVAVITQGIYRLTKRE
jgi:intracellular septation protein A